MQYFFEILGQTILEGAGAVIKKLFGRPASRSGITETWIGLLILVAVIAIISMFF
jgi:hypothetical protein